MTLRRAGLGVSLLLFTCSNCFGLPQFSEKGGASNPAPQAPAIRTTTSLVLVDVLAEDKKTGEPIRDLEKDDFRVRDDGKPADITAFNRGKDNNLRPMQLWFVLVCNEELHYTVAARRRGRVENVENLGSNFLAGKSTELRSALDHLKADDTIGVAHWCDTGEAEIDLHPTLDRDKPLEIMDQIAKQKKISVEQTSDESPQEHVLQLINDVARAAFPAPFPSIVFVGGKESGNATGGSPQSSSGTMGLSSMDFGLGNGNGSSGAADSSSYKVQNSEYGNRLGMIIDILHSRYEVGFLPGKQGKKLHHVEVTMAKSGKERYPGALFRYREAYNDETQALPSENTKQIPKLNQLDSRMQLAVKSPANQEELSFEVHGARGEAAGTQRFSLRIDPKALTWTMLPNGDRRSVVTTVVACYSLKGQPIGLVVKDLEIVQESDRLRVLKDKPVIFTVTAKLAKGAARIRLVVRDVGTGHIGSQDLEPVAMNGGGEIQIPLSEQFRRRALLPANLFCGERCLC